MHYIKTVIYAFIFWKKGENHTPSTWKWINKVGLPWEQSGQTSVPLKTAAPGRGRDPEDSFMSRGRQTDRRVDGLQHQTPTLTASTLLHRWPAHQTPSNCSYCLSSAQLKIHFSKQDAAAWGGREFQIGFTVRTILKKTRYSVLWGNNEAVNWQKMFKKLLRSSLNSR